MRPFVFCLLWVATCAFTTAGARAEADTAATIAALFSARSVADRDAAIEQLENADPKDPLVPYCLGAAAFIQSLEKLAIGLNRHGFESPQAFALPLLRLPIPPRAEPEPLTYEGFRDILLEFRDSMDAAAQKLDTVPTDVEFGAVIDLAQVGIDLDGDGAMAPEESIAAIIASMAGTDDPSTPPGPSCFPLRPRRWLLAAGIREFFGRAGRFLAGA